MGVGLTDDEGPLISSWDHVVFNKGKKRRGKPVNTQFVAEQWCCQKELGEINPMFDTQATKPKLLEYLVYMSLPEISIDLCNCLPFARYARHLKPRTWPLLVVQATDFLGINPERRIS